MPVILPPDEFEAWIDLQRTNPMGLAHLYQGHPADLMEKWPVSPMVNKVANDGPELVVPVSGDPLLELPLSP